MFTLFEKYLSSGMFYEALMIGQNLFNKNNSNKEIFEKYFCTAPGGQVHSLLG